MFGGLQSAVPDDEYDANHGVTNNIVEMPSQTPPPVKQNQSDFIPPVTLCMLLKKNGKSLKDFYLELNQRCGISYVQVRRWSKMTSPGNTQAWEMAIQVLRDWRIIWL